MMDTPRTARPRLTVDHRLPEGHLDEALRADVLAGLTAEPKTLPPKWFYDARGSRLFEEITRLPEYYPTRAEREILDARAADIARLTGAATLVELGSGSSEKTRLLLDALTGHGTLGRYVPVDVSGDALLEAGRALCDAYPKLQVDGVVADFEDGLRLPADPVGAGAGGPRLLAFLGGTLGNLDSAARTRFLAGLRSALDGPGDALLLGADLVKDPEVLVRAYDDAAGVTAEFNRNVLRVLDRRLDADLDPAAFAHVAVWDPEKERIEMRLRARRALTAKFPPLDLTVEFADGEELRTEISVKFRRAGLQRELESAGFSVREWWVDAGSRFALVLAQ